MRRARQRFAAAAIAVATILARSGAAAELPRIFMAPGERAALTASRLSGRLLPATTTATATPPPGVTTEGLGEPRSTASATAAVPVAPAPIRIDGITYGAGTRQAAWIGGQRIADGGSWSGHRVRVMRDRVQLTARDGRVRELRVGMPVPP
jgi:hypothetical protein